jgi:hypothetical protein
MIRNLHSIGCESLHEHNRNRWSAPSAASFARVTNMRQEDSGHTRHEVARRTSDLLDCAGIELEILVQDRAGDVADRLADITVASRAGAEPAFRGPTL